MAAALGAASAAMAADGTITVAIETGDVSGATQIVLDLETDDLRPTDVSITVDGTAVPTGETPFGRSALIPANDDRVTVVVTGAEGAELRLTATYIDGEGIKIAHAASRVTLAPAETTPGPQPSPSAGPNPTSSPGPVITLEPTPAPASATGQMATTGASIPWWIIGIGAFALIVGIIIFLVARKRAQA